MFPISFMQGLGHGEEGGAAYPSPEVSCCREQLKQSQTTRIILAARDHPWESWMSFLPWCSKLFTCLLYYTYNCFPLNSPTHFLPFCFTWHCPQQWKPWLWSVSRPVLSQWESMFVQMSVVFLLDIGPCVERDPQETCCSLKCSVNAIKVCAPAFAIHLTLNTSPL